MASSYAIQMEPLRLCATVERAHLVFQLRSLYEGLQDLLRLENLVLEHRAELTG